MDEQKYSSREGLIASLDLEDFKKLSSGQWQRVQEAQQTRVQERIRTRIKTALKDDLKTIAQAMTKPPYVYLSPDIRLMNGLSVRMSSLIKAQTNDVYRRLDRFMNGAEAPNNLRSGDYINQCLVAYAVAQVNGEDFGGVRFQAEDYHALHRQDPGKAAEMLEAVFEARFRAVEELSGHVYQRLVEGHHAFQTILENMSDDEDMEQALGN